MCMYVFVFISMNSYVNFVICLFTAVCVKCVEYFGEKVGSQNFYNKPSHQLVTPRHLGSCLYLQLDQRGIERINEGCNFTSGFFR